MKGILERMGTFVRSQAPRVSNPVNPVEDFADKWPIEDGLRLKLEENFWAWLRRVKEDFGALGTSGDVEYLTERARDRFGVSLNAGDLKKKFGSLAGFSVVSGKGLADQTPKSPVDHRGGGRFGWTG
jgi:hypothetical protein